MPRLVKIKFDENLIIGCVPVYVSPDHPIDLSPSIKRKCPSCLRLMWVSLKKRRYMKAHPRTRAYCLKCCHDSALAQGLDAEMIDIGDISWSNNM